MRASWGDKLWPESRGRTLKGPKEEAFYFGGELPGMLDAFSPFSGCGTHHWFLRQMGTRWGGNFWCLSSYYLLVSTAATKHHSQGNIEKKEFTGVCRVRGWSHGHHGGEHGGMQGTGAAHENLHPDSKTQGRKSEPVMAWVSGTSKPTPSETSLQGHTP